MLVTRSPAESYLYIDLHPCDCGEERLEPNHWLEERDGVFVSVYEGNCPRCGRHRKFEFALAEDHDIPPEPAFGGNQPSQLIDPGQFLRISDEAAHRVPVNLDDLPRERWAAARSDMLYAIAALEEVAKFIPEDADIVPEEVFTSEIGRAMYQANPELFSRAQIDDGLRSYREGMATFD
jgi:hypothetical protein